MHVKNKNNTESFKHMNIPVNHFCLNIAVAVAAVTANVLLYIPIVASDGMVMSGIVRICLRVLVDR
jgi:hypothetical protein